MIQMLVEAGLESATDGERPPDESNPKGYFESERVKKLPYENTWLQDCDGQVLKVVAPLLPYLPQDSDYRVIFMDRDIGEVVGSQGKMLERLDKKGADLDEGRLAAVFSQQVQFASTLLSLHKVPTLRVDYGQVIADPAGAARLVAEFLDADLDANAMAEAVDPSLYRQRKA